MNSLRIAFSTLTLLPISTSPWTPKDLKRSMIFYPLVGACLGGIFVLIHRMPLSGDLGTLLILFAWVGLTGAFHLDGLGDCFDGWGGGTTPQERQRIMKAPDLGTYGVVAIVLTLIAKAILLNHLLAENQANSWLWAIPIAARWTACFSCFISKSPAGNKGLASSLTGLSLPLFLASSSLALVGCVELKGLTLALFCIASLIAIGISRLSQSLLGGLTGDVLGATIELTEVSLLFLACLA